MMRYEKLIMSKTFTCSRVDETGESQGSQCTQGQSRPGYLGKEKQLYGTNESYKVICVACLLNTCAGVYVRVIECVYAS